MIEPCAYAECTMKSLWDLMPRLVLLCTNIGAAYHDAHHPTVNFCTVVITVRQPVRGCVASLLAVLPAKVLDYRVPYWYSVTDGGLGIRYDTDSRSRNV